ncbi:unnamed protein product [Paramecium octaurelia]|uniref:Uncharacterized protein n=1 Tax=Paramecium octaurelia TaxID=43137 RepID=A0A8S1X6Y9_PAROT|nr:unnamed protein product [Paramecium octaurelia]
MIAVIIMKVYGRQLVQESIEFLFEEESMDRPWRGRIQLNRLLDSFQNLQFQLAEGLLKTIIWNWLSIAI